MSTKSNVRLPPDGILSPSSCSFHSQKRLQSLAYGSLPGIDLSRWHLKPISDNSPIRATISSLAYTHSPVKSPTSPNGICKPIPASSPTASANFQVYSSVQSSSTSRSRKAKHANLTLPVQEDWTGAAVIPQNLPSIFSKYSIHPYSRIPQELIRQTLS